MMSAIVFIGMRVNMQMCLSVQLQRGMVDQQCTIRCAVADGLLGTGSAQTKL